MSLRLWISRLLRGTSTATPSKKTKMPEKGSAPSSVTTSVSRRVYPRDLKTSPEGLATLAGSEGVVPAKYYDTEGVATYGIGVTHWAIGQSVMDNLPWSMPDTSSEIESAKRRIVTQFISTVRQYENMVRRQITVPLYQHEFDALVHFTYNLGESNLGRSKLRRWINDKHYSVAGQKGFHGWMKQAYLKSRRDLESDMFLNADYGNKPVPVYRTNGKGKLGGRIQVISRSEVLDLVNQYA